MVKIQFKKWLIIVLCVLLGVFLLTFDFSLPSGSAENKEEQKIKSLCEKVDGAGEVSVAVSIDGEKITGIGIVCGGGDDPDVAHRLLSLISASCNVPSNRIYITYSKKDVP